MYPEEFQYTKDHEWIRLDEDIGTIGITDHAQKELGDIVYVELPNSGEQVTAAETFGTVESVKAVSEVFSPVTGKVTAVNSKLQDHPGASELRSARRGLADPGSYFRPQGTRESDVGGRI